jgi:hypothetical protein
LGGWNTPHDLEEAARQHVPPVTPKDLIVAYVDRLEKLGVTHVFTMHHSNNAFGGAAIFHRTLDAVNKELTNRHYEVEDGSEFGVSYRLDQEEFDGGWLKELAALIAYKDPNALAQSASVWRQVPGGHINALGLTEHGVVLINELMSRGMIIDIDHMSQKAVDQTLDMAEAKRYPLVSSHTHFRELRSGYRREGDGLPQSYSLGLDGVPANFAAFGTAFPGGLASEAHHSPKTIERLRNLGGLIAPMLGQGNPNDCGCYSGVLAGMIKKIKSQVPNDCAGSSKSFAQAYLYAVEKMQGRNVALSTDVNGLASQPGPRFGPNAALHLGSEARLYTPAQINAQIQAQQQAQHVKVMYDNDPVTPPVIPDERINEIWLAFSSHHSAIAPANIQMSVAPQQLERIRAIVDGLNQQPVTATTDAQLTTIHSAARHVIQGTRPDKNATAELHDWHRTIFSERAIWNHLQHTNAHPSKRQRSRAGNRVFDYNTDGMAHYGLLPDFLEDLCNIGLHEDDLAVLERSAEAYISVWERCRESARITKKHLGGP